MSTIGLNLTDIYEHVHQQHDVEQHMQLELLRKRTHPDKARYHETQHNGEC